MPSYSQILIALLVVAALVYVVGGDSSRQLFADVESFEQPTLASDAPSGQTPKELPHLESYADIVPKLPTAGKSLKPADLMPKTADKNIIDGILNNKNFLTAGSVIGIMSEPKRNSNLDLRAEPVIPKQAFAWNNSSFPTPSGKGFGDII